MVHALVHVFFSSLHFIYLPDNRLIISKIQIITQIWAFLRFTSLSFTLVWICFQQKDIDFDYLIVQSLDKSYIIPHHYIIHIKYDI